MTMKIYTETEVRRLAVNLRRLGYSEPEIIDIFTMWRIAVR